MLRLRKILLHDSIYYLIFFLTLILLFIRINIDKRIDIDSNTIEGLLIDYHYNDLKMDFIIKGKTKYKCTYYFKDDNEYLKMKDIFVLGNRIKVFGEINYISKRSNFNIIDYSKYMKSKRIYKSIYVKKISLVKTNRNVLYIVKESIYKRISNYKSKDYLYTFLLGDNRYLDKNVKNNYQKLGISHLFAISGMHITILTGTLIRILKKIKIKELSRYIISTIFVFVFLFLVSFTPSAIRSGLFFILLLINKYFYFHIKTSNVLLLTISIILLLNPFIIYNSGFLYSASITYALIVFSNKINKYNNYYLKVFMTSLIAFLISLPISLYNYYEINLLTVLYNIIFVPLVSLVIFPLACLSLVFKALDIPLFILLFLLEKMSLLLSNISSSIIFLKPNLIMMVILYSLIIIFLKGNKKSLFLLIIFLVFIYNYNYIYKTNYVLFIDVGQGDSTLIHLDNKNYLIDTGGNVGKEDYIAVNTTIPLLKSLGIKKIDFLILTHGDYDHMGEAKELVKNYKVENVIFNCGEVNYLEKNLINVLEQKKINYYTCVSRIDNLLFLQTNEYDNENDNSNVIYIKINGYRFMFMGDAGVEKEKNVLEKYNISNIDVLKVGHHGSKTSSSEDFINEMNPKYSIISVSKNNRYGHPNKEVLDNLKESKIYRTDIDGSIMFKMKNNKLKIETCSP